MKRITIILGILTALNLQAQEEVPLQLKHIKGVNALDFGIGAGQFGLNYEVGFTSYYHEKYFVKYAINYEDVKMPVSKFKDFLFVVDNNYTLFKLRERFYFNIMGSAFLGFEKIQAYTPENTIYSYPQTNKALFGLGGGVNAEMYINKDIALIAQAREYWNPNCQFGNLKYSILGGIRIIIK